LNQKVFQIISYLQHWRKASPRKGHRVHSPFVYDLIENIFNNNETYYPFIKIEKKRKRLLQSKKSIEVKDYGAGSLKLKNNKRKIRDIARYSLSSPKEAQMLFRIVNRFQPKTLVEIGTSLGITSSYLAAVNKKSKLYTLEGCPATARIAALSFKQFRFRNIELIEGEFSQTLPALLQKIDQLDFALIDGNHRYKPSIEYFNLLIEKAHNDSVFIFDDIYWSEEMQKAWQEIITRKEVTISIDLYHMGIIFFRKENSKQDFKIRW